MHVGRAVENTVIVDNPGGCRQLIFEYELSRGTICRDRICGSSNRNGCK